MIHPRSTTCTVVTQQRPTCPRTVTHPRSRRAGSFFRDLLPDSAFSQPHPPHRTKAPPPIPRERSLHEEIRKSRALLSNKLGKPSYEAVLETALDEFLAHHDPENRKQRREGRKSENTPASKAALKNPSAAAKLPHYAPGYRNKPLHPGGDQRRRLRARQRSLHLRRGDRQTLWTRPTTCRSITSSRTQEGA